MRPRLELLARLFAGVRSGDLDVEEATREAAALCGEYAIDDLGFAQVDHGRARRCGFPEVIFAQGKTPEQVVAIARSLHARNPRVLVTRSRSGTTAALQAAFPGSVHVTAGETVVVGGAPEPLPGAGLVLVICAGTSDLPVAEEARVTAAVMGCRVDLVADAGVAGIHRLLRHQALLGRADAVVVAAGMEGALPSVVGGLVRVPVIGVPTSVGYGASFGGVAALLGMLNSCAAGVCVVNIDNGFGAGCVAARIALAVRRGESPEEQP